MGKIGSPWLRGTTGKLAGMVLQGGVTRGETTIRERVVPRDPNTEAQRIQRVIMATAGVAYNRMKDIVNHSFEGYTGAAANMNRFRQLNANMLRQQVATAIDNATPLSAIYAFTPKGKNVLATNGFIISEGSLPQISAGISQGTGDISPSAGTITANATYADIVRALGLQKGDQLTLCGLIANEKPATDTFIYARIILEPSSGDMTAPFVQDNAINLPNSRNEGTSLFTFALASNLLSVAPDVGTMYGFGVIVSRKVNEKWLRSPSIMSTQPFTPTLGEIYEYSLEEAIMDQSSYIDLPSARYLNNAINAG